MPVDLFDKELAFPKPESFELIHIVRATERLKILNEKNNLQKFAEK